MSQLKKLYNNSEIAIAKEWPKFPKWLKTKKFQKICENCSCRKLKIAYSVNIVNVIKRLRVNKIIKL